MVVVYDQLKDESQASSSPRSREQNEEERDEESESGLSDTASQLKEDEERGSIVQ